MSTPISASYSTGPDSSGYKTWTFSGTAASATQFYIAYIISGTTYYNPGNNVNYQITSSTLKTSTSTTGTSTRASSTVTSSTTSSSNVPAGTGSTVSPSSIPPFYSATIPTEAAATAPTGCGNFNGKDSCASGSTYTGDAAYFDTFQSYQSLTGYTDIQYSSSRTSAAVVINCLSRTDKTLTYSFNGANQTSNIYQASQSTKGGLTIVIYGSSRSVLTLDPLYFLWENTAISGQQNSFSDSQKGAIIKLFG
ncbi:hypothetical protein ACJA88_015159 [Fusarium oxysporum]